MFTDVVECGVDTCLSGGTCLELVGGGTHCMCPPGFSGDDCCQSKTPYLLHRTRCRAETLKPVTVVCWVNSLWSDPSW